LIATRKIPVLAILLISLAALPARAQTPTVDTQHSAITIHVFKSGLFSAFADNHEVKAPISEAALDTAKREVSLKIDTKQLAVLDPDLPPEKRAQVQTRMLGADVLDVQRFPQITFRSSSVETVGSQRFRVHGDLSLHGVTAPVTLDVTEENGSYRGHCALKQSAFGIQPISIAGGSVKVKDELKIEFTIVMASVK